MTRSPRLGSRWTGPFRPLRSLFAALTVLTVLLAGPAQAQQDGRCSDPRATSAFQDGFEAQKKGFTSHARSSYLGCLEVEPECIACNYEVGWSYWKLKQWADAAEAWERVLRLQPGHTDATRFLTEARAKLGASDPALAATTPDSGEGTPAAGHDPPIGETGSTRVASSTPRKSSGAITLLTRQDVGGVRPSNFKRIREAFDQSDGNQVLVVAHRGDWKRAPENSLPAIENSITMGADVVEIDLKKTSDGHLVLMHDQTVNRTTNGRGRVSRMKLSQVKALKLVMADGTATNETVPTLEEAMLLVKGRIMVNLDHGQTYIAESMKVLERTGTVDHAILKGTGSAGFVSRKLSGMPTGTTYMPILDFRKVDLSAERQRLPKLTLSKYGPGMEHAQVAELQRALGRVPLFDDRAGFSKVVDDRTVVAIKAFQERHGLQRDGVVGVSMLKKMMRLGLIRHSSLRSWSPPKEKLGLRRSGYRKDARSPGVALVQRELSALGLLDLGGNFTEYYGSETEEAVKRFQKQEGLVADGVAGRGTLKKLEDQWRIREGWLAGTITLRKFKKGMEHDEVEILQRALAIEPLLAPRLGYSSTFDAETGEAVSEFQRRYGMRADGVAGPGTVAKLVALGVATSDSSAPQARPGHALAQSFLDKLQSPVFEIIFDNDQVPIMSNAAVGQIRRSGGRVWVNSLWDGLCGGHSDFVAAKDPELGWGWMIDRGVNMIQTDTPEDLLRYLRRRGLHWD